MLIEAVAVFLKDQLTETVLDLLAVMDVMLDDYPEGITAAHRRVGAAWSADLPIEENDDE